MTGWIEAVIIREGTISPTNELGILNLFGKKRGALQYPPTKWGDTTIDENTTELYTGTALYLDIIKVSI